MASMIGVFVGAFFPLLGRRADDPAPAPAHPIVANPAPIDFPAIVIALKNIDFIFFLSFLLIFFNKLCFFYFHIYTI